MRDVLSPRSNTTPDRISVKSVRNTLHSLRYSPRPRKSDPLEDLALVGQTLGKHSSSISVYSRSIALYHLFHSFITGELTRHRQAMDISIDTQETSRAAAAKAIAEDARTASPELLGWSWLYYHFVRVEFNLSATDFRKMASIDERTLRRYQEHAIWRLTQLLTDAEQQFQEHYRRRALYQQLPFPIPLHLYGREESLRQAESILSRCSPRHIQVTGAPGIGKTVFVQEAVRMIIERIEIDAVVWADRPPSFAHLESQWTTFLRGQMEKQKSVDLERMVFVIDGIDYLQNDLKCLEWLLRQVSPAIVYLTAILPAPLSTVDGLVHLQPLQKPHALAMIQALLSNDHMSDSEPFDEQVATELWKESEGNPHVIKQAVFDRRERLIRGYSPQTAKDPTEHLAHGWYIRSGQNSDTIRTHGQKNIVR